MPVALPVPEVVPQLYVVLFRGEPPSPAALPDVVSAWSAERVDGLLAQVMPRYLDQLVTYEIVPVSSLTLPPLEVLRYLGVGAEEEAVFRGATHAVVVQGADLPLPPRGGMWAALCAARAIARELGGVVFDPGQRRLRPLDENDEAPAAEGRVAVHQHILVPASRNPDGTVWVTTLGLDRFGLPNLQMVGAVEHLITEVTHLMNATAQLLVERLDAHALGRREDPLAIDVLEVGIDAVARSLGKDADPPEAAARVGLTLDETEGREPLLKVHPPDDVGGDLGVWLEEVFDLLFDREAQIVDIGSDDAAMREATERAVRELPEIRRRYLKGVELGDSVYVKSGFETEIDGYFEFMWVAVEAWSDGTIRGRLANDPEHVPDLRAGQLVEIAEDDVSDWIWAHGDGTREGGYTIDVLMARRPS